MFFIIVRSVSRGLQVEEQDLIQFSNQQSKTQSENANGSPSNNSTANVIPPNSINNNNDIGKSGSGKRPEENTGERLGGGGKPEEVREDNEPDNTKEGDGDIEDLDNNPNECEEDDDDEETASARTADEQMDYLESLEPCPCYAKCCLDSIITLFCVTLLG